MTAAFPYRMTKPPQTRLGLIVLQVDETIEQEFRQIIPADVALYHARVESAPRVSSSALAGMERTLPAAAGRLPPAVTFDVVGYACTSGTSVIGADRIAGLISGACRTRSVTEPVTALVAACHDMQVSRLAILSPYVAEVSERLRSVLAGQGIDTPVFGSFEEAEEAKVARIDGASVEAAAIDLAARGGVEGLFLSCTNLRTFDVIDRIEEETGLPVFSSNQVLAWHMLKLAGRAGKGPGRLSGN